MAQQSKTKIANDLAERSNRNGLQIAILAILPFLLYWLGPMLVEPTSWSGKEFVLDDQMVLSQNYYVKQGTAGIGKLLTNNSFEGYIREQYLMAGISDQVTFDQYLESQEFQLPGGRYRPLSLIVFALEHEVFGLNIQITYLINLLLYALTGILIFLLFRKLLPAYNSSWLSVPFLTALLFVLHPIHTEVVANVKSLDEILALLLSLGALWYTTQFLNRGGWQYLVLAGLVFFMGLMAKETTITFLAVIPLAGWFFKKADRK